MKRFVVVLLAFAMVFSGCSFFSKTKKQQPVEPKTSQNTKKEEPKKEVRKEYYVGTNAPLQGVKDWVYRYKQYDVALMQKMDGYRVVMVSQGEKFSKGYEVKFPKITKNADKWVVEVSIKQPAEDNYAGKSVWPYEVVSIKDDGKPIEIVKIDGDSRTPVKVVEIPEGRKLGVSKNFIVFTPLEGDKIISPVTIKGKARVFEATFRITIEDGHNRLAQKLSLMTDAGAPAWGNFELSLPFDKPTNPSGSIIFAYENMANGDIIEELILPVKF